MSEAYVYILRCADGTYYTGWTTDMDKRIKAHNGEMAGGAKYTRARRPVSVYWCAPVPREIAERIEYRIKKLSRLQKERVAKDRYFFEEIVNKLRKL